MSFRASLKSLFPHATPRDVQVASLDFIEQHPQGSLLEIPTGGGKTAIGWTALAGANDPEHKGLVYVTPTRALADQVYATYGQAGPRRALKVLGRADYPCLYYRTRDGSDVSAQESPCYVLLCGHRVDQATGATEDPSAEPCPYYLAKFDARHARERGDIVITTTAFHLLHRLRVEGWNDDPPALTVVDEAHKLASVARALFEHTITDWHLKRIAELLDPVSPSDAEALRTFSRSFVAMTVRLPPNEKKLLSDSALDQLIDKLRDIDTVRIEKEVRGAIRFGTIDPVADREALRVLTGFVPSVQHLVRSMEFAQASEGRRPLNYVVAFAHRKEEMESEGGTKRARCSLTVQSYYVAPLIAKALSGPTILLSATIGDAKMFGFETGVNLPFQSFGSSFSPENTRLYLSTDTRNLNFDKRRRDDVKLELRRVAETAKRFAVHGHRSLVVVVSEEERMTFMRRAKLASLHAITYEEGVSARKAMERFRTGEGECLVGTVAQYGEGIDLPCQTAPIIFFLRPSYPHPKDPQAQFEERRFGEQRWKIWRYRAVLQALQVRGRNVRSMEDIGVCFFISQQFRSFLAGSLPQWLRPAYRGQSTFDENVADALELLKR